MAESLLEECLQENIDLLRRSIPLMDKTQPRLCRAKGHLNTILSRGRLTVSLNHVPPGYPLAIPLCFCKAYNNKWRRFFPLRLSYCQLCILFCPSAQVLKWGSAADGQSTLCPGSLPGCPGNVCQGEAGGADAGRPAYLSPSTSGWGIRY